jgi:hypothetical protein
VAPAHEPPTVSPTLVIPPRVDPNGTDGLNRLKPSDLGNAVVEEIVCLRPAAAGRLEVAYIHNWSTYPFSKGHFAYFAPGDIGRFAGIAILERLNKA